MSVPAPIPATVTQHEQAFISFITFLPHSLPFETRAHFTGPTPWMIIL
jgi:hypothetical protein